MVRHIFLSACIALLSLCTFVSAAERKEVRILYDFEDPAELEGLKKDSENVTFDIVQDNGVTHGANCCRVIFKKGGDYGVICLGADKIKDWGNFDYIAFDIFSGAEEKTEFAFELWDGLTKGYPTRATYESNVVRPGKNTIVIPINRAKRNGKEGRDWTELEDKDKIQMNALTRVKIFTGQKGQDLTWWVDNIRLMQEDALGGKMKVDLPASAKGYLFGHRAKPLDGFIVAEKPGADARGFTLSGNLENCGRHWPDPLTGEGVFNPAGETITFETKLPEGEYWAWLAAGMTINPNVKNPHFLLKIGDQTLMDETAKGDEIFGEKHIFRFLKTQYSERPNALYLDFIDRMYPVYETKVKVAAGNTTLSVQAANHFLAALILMPAGEEAAFKKMSADIRTERMKTFYAQLNLDPQKKPQKKDGDGAYVCFVPDDTTAFNPATGPNDAERARKKIDLAAAPGERVIFRAGLTPFEDLGKCKLALSSLKGPAEIPASAARVYFQDYRVRGDSVQEAALIPSSEINVEKGVSWCWWLWMKVPDDAPAGDYAGAVTVTPANGKAVTIPVTLKIYPFKLEENLPYSFGMYYGPAADKKTTAEQLQFMREIGFTATSVGSGEIKGVNGDSVNVSFDPAMWDLAKAAGMGRDPRQYMMGNSLGAARAIGRRLGAKVDQDPGSEFALKNFKAPYMDFAKKYAEFIKQQGLPVAVEIVDEPREVPNPWNRNLKYTNTYGDWLKEAGIFPTFVTPMGDSQSGLDYTTLTDHADILSTHAGKGSEKIMKMTPEKKKMLWLYNTGMDRLSWGFYNWRVGSIGRWEWHFCFNEGGTNNGYPNEGEWFNPFTSNDAFAPHGPANYPGQMLFKSVFMTCAEGITDSAYIVTLEKAIAAAEKDAGKAAAVTKAKEFLDSLKTTIPFLPGVKNIASESEGALVGTGLNADASKCDQWRRKIAELIISLK